MSDRLGRLNDEKLDEMRKKAAEAMFSGNLEKQEQVLAEMEKLNAPPAVDANEVLGLDKKEIEDDLYLPQTNSMFKDLSVPEGDSLPPKVSDPLLDAAVPPPPPPRKKEEAPTKPVEENKEIKEEPTKPSPAEFTPAEKVSPPKTSSSDFDDFDDDDENLNPLQRLGVWIADDESGIRKWILAGGVIGIITIIFLIGIAVTSGKGKEQPVQQAPVSVEQKPTSQQSLPPAEVAGIISPSSATAKCPAEGSTPASAAFDNDPTTAWVCQRVYGVDGVVMEITLSRASTISEIKITPGFNYTAPRGEDEWNKHRVVTRVEWGFGDNFAPVVQEIIPTRGEASVSVPEVTTNKITAKILATEPADPNASKPQPGSPSDTFAVSSISIIGTGGKV